jgi:DNA-binding NarL/FixJ family response regulator
MQLRRPIWVDERNPIYRRGMVACLRAEGYSVAGESARLEPEPDLSGTSVVIFDLDAAGVDRATALVHQSEARLVGLIRETPADQVRDLLKAGLAGGLLLRTLTPARLVACIEAVVDGTAAPPPQLWGRDLTQREFEVLRLLADGDSTRDIALRLCYSERTVKNIVRDLLTKLNGRTRAHAVALAARRGVI